MDVHNRWRPFLTREMLANDPWRAIIGLGRFILKAWRPIGGLGRFVLTKWHPFYHYILSFASLPAPVPLYLLFVWLNA